MALEHVGGEIYSLMEEIFLKKWNMRKYHLNSYKYILPVSTIVSY